MIETFLTPESFLTNIEKIMAEKKINHIEAIVDYCDENGLEFNDILPVITRSMKERIKYDAMESGMMRQEAMLPL